jgi:ankyrin repeat domain-containing protein 50
MGDLVMATEQLSCLISRGAIYERLYQPKRVPDDIIANFHHALIKLYGAAIRMLAMCYRLFAKNAAKRTVHAILNPEDVSAHLEECEKLQVQVEFEVDNCERARSQEADETSKRLLEILQAPMLRTDKNVLSLLKKISEEERLKVLDWISNALYGSNHKTVKEKRTADTCAWLLDHSQYQEWHETSSSIILWLCGTGESQFQALEGY